MREHFEEQLKESKVIDEELLLKLERSSVYGEYQIGDKICYFLEQSPVEIKNDVPTIILKLCSVREKDLGKLDNDYVFIRKPSKYPILSPEVKRREKMSLKNDEWFYEMCKKVASNSKCLSRKVGSVLVRNGTIVSQGYNGPPKGSPHCDKRYTIDSVLRENMKNLGKDPDDPKYQKICPRYALGFKSGQGLDWCVAGHAERNSLINAASNGVSTFGTKLYMDCNVPCTPCLVEIINAGVEEIIFVDYKYYDLSAEYTLKNSTLKHRLYKHLCKHERVVAGFCINCKSNLNEKGEVIEDE